jgi:hypothetical protein
MQNSKEQIRISLIKTVERLGHPAEFGELIAQSLGTEKQMSRMVSYLVMYKPRTMEEIADEMLAIKDEFERYREKKVAEYYNEKYNRLLNEGLPGDEDLPNDESLPGVGNVILPYDGE